MPSPYYYYVYPFGQFADDLSSIPTNAAGDGSVSYNQGWTDPYEYNLLTDPAALPIPRGQMNQLFYDITNNLQQYQQYGTPQWVIGNTVSYPIYARVYYSGLVYESQISNNTNTPGTDSTWNVISGDISGIPVGTQIDFCGPGVPVNFLFCDGSAISRTTYASLLSALTEVQMGTITNTMNTVSGLTSTRSMYAGQAIEGTGIPSGTTISLIVDMNNITISQNATASGTISIQSFNWGNGDGSTTFNIPNLQRSTTIGSGGSGTSVIGHVAGQQGGVESHTIALGEIPNHTHGVSYWADQNPGPVSNVSGTIATSTNPGGINGYPGGGQTSLSLMQPSSVVIKCIKYQ
jgi:prepilin-type processing-associated H-X9-DG protein